MRLALWISAVVACVCVSTGHAQQGFLVGIGDGLLSPFMDTSGGLALPGDLNGDGSVDLADFGLFRGCMNGPNRPPAAVGCAGADMDGDGDVDMGDFVQFQALYAQAGKSSGQVTLSGATPVAEQTDGVVTWNTRAVVFDGDGNLIDIGAPINPANYPAGVWLQWTVSCVVTGNNQGLAGAVVSMAVKDVTQPFGVWAPVDQDPGNLSLSAVYKAPGAAVNGTVADNAGAGGLGAGAGASKGYPAIGVFYVDQMGMGYLDWTARRYKTTIPKGWVGNQQWGMGLDSRKAAILRDGAAGTYDLAEGFIEITSLPPGTYQSVIVLKDQNNRAVTTSKVLDAGQDLNQDWPAVDMTEITGDNLRAGDTFSFTIVPEPATLLLLAGAGLLARRRRA